MKTVKNYFIAFTMCVVCGVALNLNLKASDSRMKTLELTLDNIEALANTEDSGVSCFFLGSLDCPSSTIKVQYLK